MTDQTPRTEAGRVLRVGLEWTSDVIRRDDAYLSDILAIEAEAAAQARTEALDVEVLARALQTYAQIGDWLHGGITPDAAQDVARKLAAEYRAILAGETE